MSYCPRCDDDTVYDCVACSCGYESTEFNKVDDTQLILSAIKYAAVCSEDDRDSATAFLHLVAGACRDAKWIGDRFILTEEQRQKMAREFPPAYWMGAINDNLEAK